MRLFTPLKPGRESFLVFFAQLALLGLGLHLHERNVWLAALAAICMLGVWAWLRAWKRYRTMHDTPTSRIASAAQGFVELGGIALPLPGVELSSPLTQLPCLWYRYLIHRRKNDRWELEEEGESDLEFLLDDGSGQCEVTPVGAEIHTAHAETRYIDDYRHTEYIIMKGDRLYVLGDFGTHGGEHRRLDVRQDMHALLSDWKSDQAGLHARFDTNGDRRIDPQEWQLAVEAARREVEAAHRTIRRQPGLHRVGRPCNGLPYLITNLEPDGLARRFLWLSWGHLGSALAGMAGLVRLAV